jgi:hypothetical protein
MEKFSRRPSTMEGQDKGGQGAFRAAVPLLMMMMTYRNVYIFFQCYAIYCWLTQFTVVSPDLPF